MLPNGLPWMKEPLVSTYAMREPSGDQLREFGSSTLARVSGAPPSTFWTTTELGGAYAIDFPSGDQTAVRISPRTRDAICRGAPPSAGVDSTNCVSPTTPTKRSWDPSADQCGQR